MKTGGKKYLTPGGLRERELHYRGQSYALLGTTGAFMLPSFRFKQADKFASGAIGKSDQSMKTIKILLFFSLLLSFKDVPGADQKHLRPLDLRVSFMPAPVKAGGRQIVYYELHVTNRSADSLTLKKLQVTVADSKIIASFSESELVARFSSTKKSQESNAAVLPPNSSGVIYIELPLKENSSAIKFGHRLEAEITNTKPAKTYVIRGAFVKLPKSPAVVVVGAPLNGGFWAAVYDPFWERGHRRVFYTVDGYARLPGRYAIDFIKLDAHGRYAAGDENLVANWFGYASEVLAVKDGVIASTSDRFSESQTLAEHPRYPPEQATGNYVSIDIGNNLFAFYEHLKPDSIRVKPGQLVKQGDVIALLGFTGQTTGPHLHFHMADKNSPLGAEGVPFAFEKFSMVGIYPDFEKFGKTLWTPVAEDVFDERPLPKSVLKFKDAARSLVSPAAPQI